MKILVKCTLFVTVDVPDDPEYNVYFDIEENHCPGTGIVGSAIDKVMRETSEKSLCWACNLQGENKIISILESNSNSKGGRI